MKKIVFMVPSLAVGGLERMQVTLANALSRKGYQITVVLSEIEATLGKELDSNIRLVSKPPKQVFGRKIPYIRHKLYDFGLWEKRASAKELHDYYIGDEKYDVEVAFFRGLAVKTISGGVTKHNAPETRYIAWVHTDFRNAIGYKNQFRTMDEVFRAYASFDNVVCVSDEAKQGFIETIGDTGNLITIYNLLPVESIRLQALKEPSMRVNKERFHLVLVGRLLDSVKGQKRLISVVSRLHEEGESISLALVGGGVDEQMLRDEITSCKADGYVTLCGNQMNPYPFIREANLLVCASYCEGYNLTVAEALIIGTPVLSTDCSGPNEILDHGKYGIIVENNEDGLYRGIRKLVKKPEVLIDLQKKAKERQVFFDEDCLLQQIIDLFDEV